MQTVIPNKLPRVAFQAAEVSAHALAIHSPRFRIDSAVRPSEPIRWHLGEINIESVFPNRLARFRVGTNDHLAFGGCPSLVAHDRVELSLEHNRRRAPAQLGLLP